ncbi:MAG: sulfatase-like hydrolase/transferase [Verrucomicrobia bacterium]|nr:sulfatase-like hydrolase/transferase [Verrucomicrobiota bacterium]
MKNLIQLIGRLAVLGVFCLSLGQAHAKAKPNVLFLFADDQCFETVANLGLTDIDTPNLDRLASRGTQFSRAYNMGSWSGAVCVASRHMLITGRHIWRAQTASQVLRGKGKNLTPEQQAAREAEFNNLWPQVMGRAGYQTFFTGKWHISAAADKAFQVARNVRGGMPNQTPEGYNRPLPDKADPWSPYDVKFEGFWKGGKHWSEVVADDAVDYIGEAKQDERPFFMYIAFNAPHDPRQAPKEYVDRYPLSRIKVPGNYLAEYPYKDDIGCSAKLRDEKLGPFPRTHHAVKVHRQEYYAIIEHMDTQIGRILDALDASGQAENTYIFFSADHGLGVGHHGLFGKQNLYEHSTRVPFIAVGPGVKASHKIDALIYLQDVMATSLDIAGAKRPEQVEFQSLMPLLNDTTKESEVKAVYGAYLGLQRSVTVGNWKLILYPKIAKARLYNIKRDPFEMKDLAGDESKAKLIKRLYKRLRKLQQANGDTLNLNAAFPNLG